MTIPPEAARQFSHLLAALHAAADAGEIDRIAREARGLGGITGLTRATREWLIVQFQAHERDCRARLTGVTPAQPRRSPAPDEWNKLTPREREVAAHLPLGRTDAQIARHLGIARATVSKHLEHILAKTGTETRTAAVAAIYGNPR